MSKPDFFGFLPLILGDYRCPQPFQLTLPVPPPAYLTVRRFCQIFGSNLGVADLRYESSLVGFLKPRPKLTFGYDAQLAFIP